MKKLILITVLMLIQTSAQAMVAPSYFRAKVLTASIEAVAEELGIQDVAVAKISEVIVGREGDLLEIVMNGKACMAYPRIATSKTGGMEVFVDVGHCEVVRAAVIPAVTGQEMLALIAATAKSKVIREIVVTSEGINLKTR